MSEKISLEDFKKSVLYINFQGRRVLLSPNTFLVEDLIEKVKASFINSVSENEREQLFGDGIDCQLLNPSSNWQVGKVKFSIEFIPDETDSPLDDIRQQISEEGDRD